MRSVKLFSCCDFKLRAYQAAACAALVRLACPSDEEEENWHSTSTLYQYCRGMLDRHESPLTIITDGLQAYQHAAKEYYSNVAPRTKHIYGIKLQGEITNNKMERMNGEIRDREKVTRGLKRKDTPILKGIQLYHNAIKPHQGLKGKTPLEACGIKVEGENKWLTLIQNASKK